MRRIVFVLMLVAVIAGADTLDFSDWSIQMTVVEQPDADELADIAVRGLGILRTTYFDENQTVADYLMFNPKIARALERLRPLPILAGTKYRSDGSIASQYRLKLTGSILQTLMPKTGGGVPVVPMACPVCGQPWPEHREVPPGISLVPIEDGKVPGYTGVLIDARGLELNPALFPRIVNEDGKVVYGPEFFLPTYAAERGAVSYYNSISAALADDRLGYNPLRITAQRVEGNNSTTIVIANSDARKLHGSLENLRLLERCRVIILTD